MEGPWVTFEDGIAQVVAPVKQRDLVRCAKPVPLVWRTLRNTVLRLIEQPAGRAS